MMVNIETAISFLNSQIGKVSYSMYGSRNFSDGTCDCSGAVYTALRKGGASNLGYIASTETLHNWLLNNGFKLIAENSEWQMKRGDVVIWGRRGQSAGAGGHTGICVDSQNWLECTAWRDLGETQQNHDARWAMNNNPYFYVYRLASGGTSTPTIAPVSSNHKTVATDVTYALRSLNGGWLDNVTNFGSGDNGFAGMPNQQHDYLTISVNHGSVKYRVKTAQDGWLGWVSGSNRNDLVNGAAGTSGHAITGVQIIYNTPAGEAYQQAYYRSQTTHRSGWLGVCADDGSIPGLDSWAGMDGEPLDRLQIKISPSNPF